MEVSLNGKVKEEEKERTYIELLSQGDLGVGVHRDKIKRLATACLDAAVRGEFLEDGRQHFAGVAPAKHA